jgi:hypothetical protein
VTMLLPILVYLRSMFSGSTMYVGAVNGISKNRLFSTELRFPTPAVQYMALSLQRLIISNIPPASQQRVQ